MTERTDFNMTLVDAAYKDAHPLQTVERIRKILADNGIETEETWLETGVPYCRGIRIGVVGTTFSVNGKGLTKDFALASGYGELMERLQMGYIGSADVQKDGHHALKNVNAERISADELYARNEKWYRKLSDLLYAHTGVREAPRDLIAQYADDCGMVDAMPFYNISKGCREHYPSKLLNAVYSANGCAAGNSREEALVQGISEVVERHFHLRIISEQLSLPDIPEEVLKRCKVAYEIISFIRAVGYRVIVKDCSLGTRFPVVCVCFIHKRTGRYHSHFGAYPIFEIALERALTETFQGRNIYSFASFSDFVYRKEDLASTVSIANEMTKGTWEKQPGFFVGEPRYPYNAHVGFQGANNAQLLRQCVEFLTEQGYDVLVRDRSCLGFPTYQVLVPGYSEIFIYRLSRKLDDHRYFRHAARTLRNPSTASREDMEGLLLHLAEMDQLTRNIAHVHGFLAAARLSAQLPVEDQRRLMAASVASVHYSLGDTDACIAQFTHLIPGKNDQETAWLICLKRYLSLKQHGYSNEELRRVLVFFHGDHLAQELENCIAQGKNPFDRLVLHCDGSCTDTCRIYRVCCQKRVAELAASLAGRQREMDTAAICPELLEAMHP